MAFQFPWTNLHELNLDWFLSKFKQFTNNYLATTATAESVPNGTPPSVTVTGGDLDDDTDIVDPFTFNFKIPAGAQGEQGEQGVPGVPGQDGFSPIATVTKSGSVATITITDANGTTTATISDGTVNIDQLNTKAPAIYPTISGSNAHFSDGADNLPMSELTVGITPSQSGSGDPAPNNIRPISGWTGVTVTHTGKNMFSTPYDISKPDGYGSNWLGTSIENGWIVQTGRPAAVGGYGGVSVHNIKAGTYTFSFDADASATLNNQYTVTIYSKYTDGTENQQTLGYAFTASRFSSSVTFTADIATFAIRATASGSDNTQVFKYTNVQLESGSSATAYEPYQSNTITVDWTSEAGTVYSGTLDVKTGVLTVDGVKIVFDGSQTVVATNWRPLTNSVGWLYAPNQTPGINNILINNNNFYDITLLSDTLRKARYSGTDNIYSTDAPAISMVGSALYGIAMRVDDTSLTTATAINAWLALHPVTVVYPLATPQTYQLTPQQLFNTLYGVNNVWSVTGDSTVTYTADTMLYIQNLTQPTEDDMTANNAIANGKFFMIGNNLYRATTAIASGSKIIPGTNATPMSLADALNLL